MVDLLRKTRGVALWIFLVLGAVSMVSMLKGWNIGSTIDISNVTMYTAVIWCFLYLLEEYWIDRSKLSLIGTIISLIFVIVNTVVLLFV